MMKSFSSLRRLALNRRQLCDLELLLNGAFHPLNRFLNAEETAGVLENYHLPDGTFWPLPIFLDVFDLKGIKEGGSLCLCDGDGTLLARLLVESIWEPDKQGIGRQLFSTTDESHPGLHHLLHGMGPFFLGGFLELIQHPRHYDFLEYRPTPRQFKERLISKKIKRLVGFNTRNPMHRVHYELTRRAMEKIDGDLLIQPVVGVTKPGDIDYVTRVKCHQALLKYYPAGRVHLSLLPLAMRMAGPREALLHGIIRSNFGCTHFIVGRDQVSPGLDRQGRPFYPPYAAQELFKKFEKEIGLEMIFFPEMAYSPTKKRYVFVGEEPAEGLCKISGTQLRQALKKGETLPEWFSFPEVMELLRKASPPKSERGLVIFFTGLPGSGKSTLANHLAGLLRERSLAPVTLLDGDILRRHLSNGLGFSKEDRDTHIRRIGFVASLIAKHKGLCICCAIAPYEQMRQENRRQVEACGGNYIEVYVSTPLAVCEQRDPKGWYAQARKGELKQFTGIDDPYEPPSQPEIVIETETQSPEASSKSVLNYLVEKGYC